MVGVIIGLKPLINSASLYAVCWGSSSVELSGLLGGLALVSTPLHHDESVY